MAGVRTEKPWKKFFKINYGSYLHSYLLSLSQPPISLLCTQTVRCLHPLLKNPSLSASEKKKNTPSHTIQSISFGDNEPLWCSYWSVCVSIRNVPLQTHQWQESRGNVSCLIPTRAGKSLWGRHHENETGMKIVHHFTDCTRISLQFTPWLWKNHSLCLF